MSTYDRWELAAIYRNEGGGIIAEVKLHPYEDQFVVARQDHSPFPPALPRVDEVFVLHHSLKRVTRIQHAPDGTEIYHFTDIPSRVTIG